MTTTTDRPWLVEGAQIAMLTTDSGKPAGYQVRTVARFTTTQVVLDDGGKWRLKDLRPVGEDRSTWSTTDHELAALDDPRVTQVRVLVRLRNLGRVVQPWLTGDRTRTDVAGALELLALVKQAVADTEARITALTPPTSKED